MFIISKSKSFDYSALNPETVIAINTFELFICSYNNLTVNFDILMTNFLES